MFQRLAVPLRGQVLNSKTISRAISLEAMAAGGQQREG